MDSPRTAKSRPPKKASVETITGFDPVEMAAPFLVRLSAAVFDYILLIALPAIGIIFNRIFGGSAVQDGIVSGTTLWLVAILLGLCNIVLLPALSGQSLGMILTGLRIVRLNGRSVTPITMALRNTVGYLLTALTFGLGFFVAAVNTSGRALHDFLFGTVVVAGIKRRRLQS